MALSSLLYNLYVQLAQQRFFFGTLFEITKKIQFYWNGTFLFKRNLRVPVLDNFISFWYFIQVTNPPLCWKAGTSANQWGKVFLFYRISRYFSSYRVHTLISSNSRITFHDFFSWPFKVFHDLTGLAVTFYKFLKLLCRRVFLTLNSSTDTTTGVHQDVCPCFVICSN